jgi:Ca2+-binding EF-hand superfamily protein
MEKFKYLLFSSGKNIQEFFERYDVSKSGIVSNVEMKNILLKMSLGLSNKDIDLVIKFCDPNNPDKINYINLIQRLKLD